MRRPVRYASLAVAAACAVVPVLVACSSQVTGKGHFASEPAAPGPSSPASPSIPAPVTSSEPAITRTSSPPPATPTPAPKPVKTVTAHGQDGRSYVIKVWAIHQERDCAAHAYGKPMITFLRKHPCEGMLQLIATTTVDGKAVGFAQNSISFGGSVNQAYRNTAKFRALVTRNGTGNLNDLLREGLRLPSGPKEVPSPDAFTALSQDNGCTVTDSWYLHGPTPSNAKPLEQMATDIYLQV